MSRGFLLSPPFVRIFALSLAAGVAGFQIFPTAPLRLAELARPRRPRARSSPRSPSRRPSPPPGRARSATGSGAGAC